jgi:hypothetical protein
MTIPANDQRSAERRTLDDKIAAEPKLQPPELPVDSVPSAVEVHLARVSRQPLAMAGIVENGLIRPINPAITLPEHTRVIIVTAELSDPVPTVRR